MKVGLGGRFILVRKNPMSDNDYFRTSKLVCTPYMVYIQVASTKGIFHIPLMCKVAMEIII